MWCKKFDFAERSIFFISKTNILHTNTSTTQNLNMPTIKKISKNTSKAKTVTIKDTPLSEVEVMPISESEVPDTSKVEIPKALFRGFSEMLRQQQLIVAQQIVDWANENGHSLEFDTIVKECIPEAPVVAAVSKKKTTAKSKKKTEKLTDYTKAQTLEELKVFKVKELKDILASKNLPITGSKTVLMARVWGILHPDQAPKEEKKKRGRKKKAPATNNTVIPTTIDIEQDTEECELDPEKMPTIEIEGEEYKTFAGKYVFKEGEEDFDFIGVLNEDKKSITHMDEHPDELLKLLGADE